MRRVVCATALLAACVIFSTPAAAQEQNQWFVTGGFGGSFGTLGTTPNLGLSGGYEISRPLSIVGEFGMVSHAPFERASMIAGPVTVSQPAIRDRHVNGYHYNANLMVRPGPIGRVTPYITGGFGAFTGQTVARVTFGSFPATRRGTETNWASNIGGGATYRLTDWLGANVDYRHFAINAADRAHVNRFATGLSLYLN
jgi:opacity protein-like surface antigen